MPLQKKKTASKPVRRKPGACDHQKASPCWKVKMPDKDYHWPDEDGAVMFACRHSRELAVGSTVFDPLGNVVVQFGPREYDTAKYRRHSSLIAGNVLNRLDDLQAEAAKARRERLAPTTKKIAPVKKAAAKKPLRKKVG